MDWSERATPRTVKYCYKNDRARNIERFAASALNFLRLYIENQL